MTPIEVLKAKKEAESKILAILQEFNRRTGFVVTSVEIENFNMHVIRTGEMKRPLKVAITVEL